MKLEGLITAVTGGTAFAAALDAADTQAGGLRGLVHCAGGGRRLRIPENGYLNGETIRLDGAIRMAPR